MFLTGFSSHFISIFLAAVLPWLIIMFGKDTGQQIIAEAKIIFHFDGKNDEEAAVSPENFNIVHSEKKLKQKQVSAYFKPDKSEFVFCVFNSHCVYPANDKKYETPVSRNKSKRAPPVMFTI